MGGKIDVLLKIAQDNQVELAKINQQLADMRPRCDSHAKDIEAHDMILRGDQENNREGICERIRGLEKKNAVAAATASALLVALWEGFKFWINKRG